MKILVTGGTGFVGGEIVRQLCDATHGVRVLSRTRPVTDDGVERVQGSVLDPATLRAAMEGIDVVLHLVGIISELGDQTFERVHTEGTRQVLSAAGDAGVTRYVHMSALGTRPGAQSRYHQSKWEAEECVRRSRFDWTILRPSLIYGRGDRFVNLFAGMARVSPVLPVIGPGTNLLQPVAVRDVAHCFVRSVTIHESVSRTLDVCGLERFTMDQVLTLILEAIQITRMKVHLPWSVARWQARVLETVFPAVLGRASPLNRDQIRMLQEDNIGDPHPAMAMFGYEPVRFREGIHEFLGK